jgi:nitrate/nitrite-specific signal transduction histidine kinase
MGGRLLGVITVQAQHRIEAEEAESIKIIADQFGVALEHAHLFGSMQYALESMQFLSAVSQRISTAMSVDEVITAYLEQVAAQDRYACAIGLVEIDHLERRTAMVVRGRWDAQNGTHLGEERWSFQPASFTPLLDAGQSITFRDIRAEPAVPDGRYEIPARADEVALALIPLMVRGKRIGVVMLSCPTAYEWLTTDLQPYQATTALLATSIDSRQQHLLLSERGQQLAVLEERRRLARELHDFGDAVAL